MGKGKEMITLRELKEKAVSKQQQKLMGLALAYKRGDVPDSEVSDTVKDLAKSMSTKELEDFASTKHKGLPQKKEDNNISNRSAAMVPQTYNDPVTGKKKVRMIPSKSNIVKTNDRVDEAFKKGDVVKVNLGPHKHLKHEVIHAFDDGTYNIKPYDLAPSKNRYPGGAVKVKSNQIQKLGESVELNEAVGITNGDISKLGKAAEAESKRMMKSAKSSLDKDDASRMSLFADAVFSKKLDYIKSIMTTGDTESREQIFKLTMKVLGTDKAKKLSGSKATGMSESVELDEAKSSTGYELYHRDFSSAMQHAYKHAKAKLGVDVDPEEIDKKVAMGPRKPSKGKTNSYRLLDKGGKKAIQVQVYGMDNGKYELNMYKESVNEAKDPGEYDNEGEMAKNQLKSILRDAEHMIKMFDDEENLPEWVQNKITKAQDYLQSAHSYMMGQDEDDVKESVNEVGFQGTAATTLRVGAVGAAGAAAYAAKKARDRLDPVKVAKARRDRDEKKAEVDKAKQELDQRKKYRQKLRDMQRKQRVRQAAK